MSTSNIRSLPTLADLEDEANGWIVRLEEGEVSALELAEFDAWRKQSAAHEEAFERLSAFWDETDIIEKLDDYAESDAAIEGMRGDRVSGYVRMARRIALGAIAASLVAVAGVNTYNMTFGPSRSYRGEYQTVRGGLQTINLPDGSEIILNTDSVLSVAYTRDRRIIRLDKGEAFFEVASNKKRPFTVVTDRGEVTAVGTAFSVKLQEEKIGITVTEGRIAFDLPDKGLSAMQAKPVEVSAGQAATAGRRLEAIASISDKAISKELDWRDGVLTFEGETLEEVIAEIGRYTDVDIEIGDEGLRNERIVAYYRIGNIESVLEALELMDNVEIERLDKSHVRLQRADNAEL